MTLWDKIIRGSAWSSGPSEADIARYLLRSENCPLCPRHGFADIEELCATGDYDGSAAGSGWNSGGSA